MRRAVLGLVGLLVIGVCAHAAQTVTGTVQSGTHEVLVIAADGDGKKLSIKPAPGAVIMRGQVGKQMREASLLDFAPGDRIVTVVKQDGTATSIKGFYSIVRGTVLKVSGEKIHLEDGTIIQLRPGTDIVFGEGRLGKPHELKPGTLILSRLNPTTKEAWTVVATIPELPSPETPAVPTVRPVITLLKYTGPSPLNVRDWMRVDMEGTPGCRATFQVKGLIPTTVMREIEPGKYRASVMIPGGKPVTDAPLVGKLTLDGVESEPVQAAKLFNIGPVAPPSATVVAEAPPALEPERMPVPPPVPEPAPKTEPAAVPAEQPGPESPKPTAPVTIVSPADGSRITRAILVKGTAEPGSHVLVKVHYTNRQTGVLAISGDVASQLVGVNDKGQFTMGPIALEGPLATKGLVFTVRAAYPDSPAAASVTLYGDRG